MNHTQNSIVIDFDQCCDDLLNNGQYPRDFKTSNTLVNTKDTFDNDQSEYGKEEAWFIQLKPCKNTNMVCIFHIHVPNSIRNQGWCRKIITWLLEHMHTMPATWKNAHQKIETWCAGPFVTQEADYLIHCLEKLGFKHTGGFFMIKSLSDATLIASNDSSANHDSQKQ